MTTISPFVVGEIKEVELTGQDGTKKKYWKKEILPSGTRQYKGQTLDFSKINPACVKAFDEGARPDGVPFVLALADNKHPERGQELDHLEGDLHKLELGSDGGLNGYFDLSNSQKVQDLIKKTNNKLGVSGRIEVDYEREDIGKKWEYVLSHVCGTTGPHVKGMKPWESVELSEDDKKNQGKVIDFSTEVIDPETKETGDDLVAVEIPKAQLDKLLAFMNDFEEVSKQTENEGEGEGEGKATLSEADQKRIDLLETQASKGFELAEKAHIELAETRWSSKRADLVRQGVPPVILDAAEPLLKLHKRPTIELTDSAGKKSVLDASDIVERVLDACKGTIKLGEEEGHSISNSSSTVDKEYEAFEKDFFSDIGNM